MGKKKFVDYKIQISLGRVHYNVITDIAEKKGIGKSELIRRCIDNYIREEKNGSPVEEDKSKIREAWLKKIKEKMVPCERFKNTMIVEAPEGWYGFIVLSVKGFKEIRGDRIKYDDFGLTLYENVPGMGNEFMFVWDSITTIGFDYRKI